MTRERITAAIVVASICAVTPAIGAPAGAAPGPRGDAVSASSELQQEYPLHEPKSCCSGLAASSAGSVEPPRSGPGASADGFPAALPILLALLGALCVALATRALALRGRGRNGTVAPGQASDADRAADVPARWRPRSRRIVSPGAIRLARPLFRYSWHRDAYVLRVIGGHLGPVLKLAPTDGGTEGAEGRTDVGSTTEPSVPVPSRPAAPESGGDETFTALRRSDRCCRLMLKALRESRPDILETPELKDLAKLARRQLRANRELLGTGPGAVNRDRRR
jgi:hypothetical protein